MSRSNLYKWMFYFWLPFQLWRLVTHATCNIISDSFLFCIPRKLYFHFWTKVKAKSIKNRNCMIFLFLWESQGSHVGLFLLCFTYPLQCDTYFNVLAEIFLKLSMKTVQVHLIIGTTLLRVYSRKDRRNCLWLGLKDDFEAVNLSLATVSCENEYN